MTQDEVILRLDNNIASYTSFVNARVSNLDELTNEAIADLKQSVSDKAGRYILDLTPLISRLYLSANYHYLRVMFYASPGLIAVLAAIIQGILMVYKIIKQFADIIHLAEILQAAKILRIIWPSFRNWWDGIMRKVSDFSKQLGWGADGLSHLLNVTTTVFTTVSSLRGRTPSESAWWRFEKSQDALIQFGAMAESFSHDPAKWIGDTFDSQQAFAASDLQNWWGKTSAWIEETTKWADSALTKVSGLIIEFAKFQDFLPITIANHIPREIWNTLNRTSDFIDDEILPIIQQVNRTMEEINAVMEAQRQRTALLVEQLTRPGDLLLGLEDLTQAGQWDQLSKIDDITSRKFISDIADYDGEETIIMRQLESVSRAVSAPTPPPSFMRLEDMVRNPVHTPGVRYYSTWQVGNY